VNGVSGATVLERERDVHTGKQNTITARVFRSDSPGKAAQWLARSIRER
jgi:hypothetical protein